MQSYFTRKPPLAAKRRSLRLPQKFLPPLKILGFCSAKPKKKPPMRATISEKVSFWCPCTTRLEPILRKNAEKHKPRRLACASARCAPPEKTLCIFFEISPAKIFLEKEKGFFCRVRFALWQNSGVNSKIISSGLPLCDLEPPMLDRYGQKIYQEIKARRQSLFPDSRSPKGLRVAFMPSLAASFLVHENCR